MNAIKQYALQSRQLVLGAVMTLILGCADMGTSGGTNVALNGAQEVPPVTTAATGSGVITVGADKSVSGSVTTTGVAGIAAHIHEAAAGKNGRVIVPLAKAGDNAWSVPAGAKLTDEQYASFKAGNLYINVHSAANKGGEIRGQLKP